MERFEPKPGENLEQEPIDHTESAESEQPQIGREGSQSLLPQESAPTMDDSLQGTSEVPESPSPEMELPPEAQGETNGGPLGCCLGVMVGLVLSLTVAVLSRLYADPLAQVLQGNLAIVVRIALVFFAIVGSIVFGYYGWKLGKRFYREYELSPRQKQRLERLEQKYRQRVEHK